MSSSGLPRKIEGIKSRKVWVIDIATMKITRTIGFREENKGRAEIKNAETKFTCMPGVKPVIIPAEMPKINAKTPNSIILLDFKI